MRQYPPPQNNTLALLLAFAAFALGYLLGAGEVPAVLRRGQPETPPAVQREPAGASVYAVP